MSSKKPIQPSAKEETPGPIPSNAPQHPVPPSPPAAPLAEDKVIETSISSETAKPVSTATLVKEDTDKFPDTPTISESEPTRAGADADPVTPAPKKRGRPPGSKTKKETPAWDLPSGGPNATPPAPEAPPVDYDALAGMCIDMSTQSLAMLIGPEWLPQKLKDPSGAEFDERLILAKPLAKYMASKQMPDLPPGALLLLAIAMYSSRRVRAPNTREKLKGVFGWVKFKFRGFFGKKKKTKEYGFVSAPTPKEAKDVTPKTEDEGEGEDSP